MPRTATTANAILGMLALRRRWPIYELAKEMHRNMRFFWPRAESRVYAESKRLAERELATATTVERRGRPQTSYAITAGGRAALRDWLDTEPRATTLECEPLLRVLLADHATGDQLAAAIERVRADAHEILDVGASIGPAYLEGRAPFQEQIHVRGLVFDFLSNHALMLLGWADRTEALLDRWPEMSETERADEAARLIEANLAGYPDPPTDGSG